MKKKEKTKIFLDKLHNIYNNKQLNLSKNTKSEILKQYTELMNGKTNINYASYHLYPFIKNECYNNKSDELDELLKLVLKYRWRSYFGMILCSAFDGFR